MERRFRLTSSTDIQRVRRSGQSYAHPLVVLVLLERGDSPTRFAVTAGASIGNAVKRNRAKRLLRAALQGSLAEIKTGYEAVLIARKGVLRSTSGETKNALISLLVKAGMLESKTNG